MLIDFENEKARTKPSEVVNSPFKVSFGRKLLWREKWSYIKKNMVLKTVNAFFYQ